jgi:probable phosphoglycerate mutase
MEIYFVRHGESEANRLNVISNRGYRHGLTARGKGQAEALAAKLADRGITRIYTSPLLRAVQTAQILASAVGLRYDIADALREFDCGLIEGKSDPASWALYHALWQDWTEYGRWERRIEGGESRLDLQARFVPFTEQLVSRYKNCPERIVLVGHGGMYRCMLPLVLRNIDLSYADTHQPGCTGHVVAEAGTEGLICREWDGTDLRG